MCTKPIYLKERRQNVPCGKCHKCMSKRISGWSFRLVKEAEISDVNLFVTLTSKPKNWHTTDQGLKTLDKNDLKLFYKKLRVNLVRLQNQTYHKRSRSEKCARRDIGPKDALAIKFKYYSVGEYGSNTQHPHYHIILMIKNVIPYCTSYNIPYYLFTTRINDTIERSWSKRNEEGKLEPIGFVHFGNVTEASIAYTLKYINKTTPAGKKRVIRDPLRPHIIHFGKDDRIPEFALMSKGLGKNYLTKNKINWHQQSLESRMFVPMKDGKRICLPRYYKEKIYTKYQRQKVQKYFQNPDAYKAYIHLKLELGSITDPDYLNRLKMATKHLTWKQTFQEMEKKRNFTLSNNKRLSNKL